MELITGVEGIPPAIGPYSPATKSGGLIFVSGQMPQGSDGEFRTGDIKEQTEIVLGNLRSILEHAGSSLDLVLTTTVYLTDLSEFGAMNEVYAATFGAHRPARATVQVANLLRGVRIEISAVAEAAS